MPEHRGGFHDASNSVARTSSISKAISRWRFPQEDGGLLVYSSTQHPDEVQHLVAHATDRPVKNVVCICRRMGGAFGGKESQAATIACIAALMASKTGRACKLRLDRDDDMIMTGKRHDFVIDYEVGFDDDGRIHGVDFMFASRCGMSADLSGPVNDRTMFHCDNAYFLENINIVSHRCKTNTVSNTAFRGFGGPQGMFAIEYVIDDIARTLRHRSARGAAAQFLRHRRAQCHALPAGGRRQHH